MYLFMLPLFAILKISCAISGVIWSKKDQNFVPLFSIATFSAIHDERVERFREIEYHNFNGEMLKISYFQVSLCYYSTVLDHYFFCNINWSL